MGKYWQVFCEFSTDLNKNAPVIFTVFSSAVIIYLTGSKSFLFLDKNNLVSVYLLLSQFYVVYLTAQRQCF